MSVLSRIRSFFASLFGGADEETSESTSETDTPATDSERAVDADRVADEAAPDDEPAHRCSICGTPVEDPAGPCPLCRSSDVVPAEEVDAGGGDGNGSTLDGTRVTRSDDDEDAVNRLRELRQQTGDTAAADGTGSDPSGAEEDQPGDEEDSSGAEEDPSRDEDA